MSGAFPGRGEQIPFVHYADDLALFEYWNLGNIIKFHARIGRHQLVVGADRNGGALIMPARDQVAQITVLLALDETLFDHPVIVEYLRQVFFAAVADKTDHALGPFLLPHIPQSRASQ